MPSKPFHLAYFLGGSKVQGWKQRWALNDPAGWMGPELYVHVARELERGCLDYILLEDQYQIADRYGSSMAFAVENALSTPRQDPSVLATAMLGATGRIGLIPTLPTFAYHPYLLARLIGSMAQISGGRVGWNVVTGSSQRAYQNFGLDEMPEHDLRYEMASEFVALTNALWSSWDEDSVVMGADQKRFADPDKVHRVDFRGRWFSSRGPLNIGPIPDGRPAIAQAGSSVRGRRFAAEVADTVVAEAHTIEEMKRYRLEIREHARAAGRDPDLVKVLFTICPIVGTTDADAAAVLELRRTDAQGKVEQTLALLSNLTDIDFSVFPLDEPLEHLTLSTQGTQATLTDFIERARGRTLREAALEMQAAVDDAHGLVGSPDTVAGRMCELMEEVGGDGFLLANDTLTRRSIAEFVDGLIPELQRRGAVRCEYSAQTLRGHLSEF
ncbi:MAG: NtaA/DmoA family FMN-dependent monooxygenase [Jatrophihabitantaceae bacterium]